MTSAPKLPSVGVQAGPATTLVKSMTSKPSSTCGAPFARGVRSGNCGRPVMFAYPLLVSIDAMINAGRCDRKVYFQTDRVGNGSRAYANRVALVCLPNRFAPVQRVRPGPGRRRPVQPIAGTDEIVGRGKIISGIRDDRTPSVVPCPRLQGAHQSQLQGVAGVPLQHADTTEIAGVE